MQGLKVKEVNVPDNFETISIDLTNQPNGIYYFRLLCNGETVGTAKVVKL